MDAARPIPRNLCSLLRSRELGMRPSKSHRKPLEKALETGFVHRHSSSDIESEEDVLSTIAVDVSFDGQYLVTTHGDHTVKVFYYSSQRVYRVLHGHPRTPWTAKFHPTNTNIVASGCLGGEVRLWDVKQGACTKLQFFPTSIISLAFHPIGPSIAVASGAALFVWNYNQPVHNLAGSVIPLVQHNRTIKAAVFLPQGRQLLLAAPESPRNHQLNSTPCRLFSLQLRLNEAMEIVGHDDGAIPHPSGGPLEIPHLSDLPTVLPRVHVYSDGGLDISKDGQYLFVCAVLAMTVPTSQLMHINLEQAMQSPGGISDIPDSFMVPVIHQNVAVESTRAARDSWMTRIGATGLAQIPQTEDHICLFRLTTRSRGPPTATLVRSCHVPRALMLAITSAKLSPTGEFALLGYGVRKNGVVERHPRSSIVACELIRISDMRSVAVMEDDVDEVNIAFFHNLPSYGVVYGTKRGKVRVFTRDVDATFSGGVDWLRPLSSTAVQMSEEELDETGASGTLHSGAGASSTFDSSFVAKGAW